MKRPFVLLVGIILLNLVLATSAQALAPAQVGTTADRLGYEYVAQHPLAPDCPHSIFCYRVLVPALLAHVPGNEVTTWRTFTVLANTATGTMLSLLTGSAGAAVLASVLFQSSFGATFTLFDPFTPDAAVAVIAAALALCWRFDRPRPALLVAVVGVFAKETVALLISAIAVAALVTSSRRNKRAWLVAALTSWLALLLFHGAMDLAFGWSERGSPSADLLGGAWLARWLSDSTLSPASHVFNLFIPFAFAWLYAALGIRAAPERLRSLAFGSLVLLPLVYVQTPERALATAAFVVVPLAALYLARAPFLLALAAAAANGLLTARVGLSTPLLPPVSYLLIVAGILAVPLAGWSGIAAWLSSRRAPLVSSLK